nr:unnamed protein product [Digitaria exilis]
MGFVGDTLESVRTMQVRNVLSQVISLGRHDCYLSVDHMEGIDSCDGERGREIPIVHRVIKVHERQDTAEVDILTKGDNNFGDDRLLYAHGQLWLQQHHIMGRAVGFLPYVGWITIVMTEKPIIKYLLMGALGLLVITSKD